MVDPEELAEGQEEGTEELCPAMGDELPGMLYLAPQTQMKASVTVKTKMSTSSSHWIHQLDLSSNLSRK